MTVREMALAPPVGGRRFDSERMVRLGDVLPSGLARLDSIARYLQDVAADDGRDARIENRMAWLVRKTIVEVLRRPALEEPLALATWASASGARWAERRTTITVEGEVVVEAASLWVCVDIDTMRPARLTERFWTVYGEAVGDQVVSSRLSLPDPTGEAAPPPSRRPWPLRVADFDRLGHVNNAATWVAVEDELQRSGGIICPFFAELEYRSPIDHAPQVDLVSRARDGELRVWLADHEAVLAAALVRAR